MSDRDEKLRHSMLTACRIFGSRTDGNWAGAVTLIAEARDDDGQTADGDEHGERLINELVDKGLLEEERSMYVGAGKPALHRRRFRLTRMAFQLWMEQIPPVPGVWDGRLE